MESEIGIVLVKSIFLCLFIIFGITGNSFVCVAVWKKRRLRTLPNYLVFNLATSDLLFCITTMPFMLVTAIAKKWILGDALCQISGLLTTHFCLVSIFTLVFISINRYFAVGRPQQYTTIFTARRVFIAIGIIWLLAFLFSFPPLIGWSRFRAGDNFCTIDGRKDKLYAVIIIFVAYIIPLVSLVVLYTRIFFLLRRHATVMKKLKANSPGKDFDSMSSSEVGSLRRRYDSNINDQRLKTQTISNPKYDPHSRTNGTHDAKKQTPLSESPSYRRSKSMDDVDLELRHNSDGSNEHRNRSSSIHMAQPLSTRTVSATEVDIQDLPVFRNQRYVNNVKLNEERTSNARISAAVSSSETGLDQHGNGEVNRGRVFRASTGKIASLGQFFRHKTKPNLRHLTREAKITRMLFTVVAVFFVCWTPLIIGSVLYAFKLNPTNFNLIDLGIMMGCLNSLCNPIIYAFMNKHFRSAFLEIVDSIQKFFAC